MGTYESSTTVAAAPDELFSYLSDIHNLPEYFAAMKSAEPAGKATGEVPAGAEAVHSVAEVNGQRAEGEAWFLRDADARKLSWGSEGPNDYHGDLEVDGDGESSTVTVRLYTEHSGNEQEIREGVQTTLAQIKEIVEGRGRSNPS